MEERRCQLDAYLQQVLSIPSLAGEPHIGLQTGLLPVLVCCSMLNSTIANITQLSCTLRDMKGIGRLSCCQC